MPSKVKKSQYWITTCTNNPTSAIQIASFMTHKWSSWDHFWPFFGQLHENISQKRDSDGHFEVLGASKS